MNMVLIRAKTIDGAQDSLGDFLKARGVKQFDSEKWLQDWLNDKAGSFWGRRYFVPKLGDVCIADFYRAEEKDGSYLMFGKISDSKCVFKAKKRFEGETKVRIIRTGGDYLEAEIAAPEEGLSKIKKVGYKLYYTARGVSGLLQSAAWNRDIVYLEDVVPNERLPIQLLAGFERVDMSSLSDREFTVYRESAGREDETGYALAVECGNCDGDGEVTCDNCNGTGRYEPTCRACGGIGYSPCRRCGGSGSFHGGTCYGCNGTGNHECGVCHGDGHLDFECKACNGSGERECWVCRGSGVRFPFVDYKTGEVTVSGADKERVRVTTQDLFLWSKQEKRRIALEGSWSSFEKAVRVALDNREGNAAREAKLQKECALVLEGLQTKLEHFDKIELPTIHAKLSSVSMKRIRGKAVYRLREIGTSEWKDKRNEPYDNGAKLKIEGHEAPRNTSIEYIYYDYDRRELIVAFPQEMDVSPLMGIELEISAVKMPPAEKRQSEFLQRWMAATNSPIYKAIVGGCQYEKGEKLELFNKAIAGNKRQREAVEIGASEIPLFLLKGPPGTGKTTIIVEIIRQAIHKGQRVLLTSQTHQAVENVLKKLDEIYTGGDRAIRMVHFTAQEGKASPLAMKYRDGSGTEELKEIKEKVDNRLTSLTAALGAINQPEVLARLKNMCKSGAEGAKRLIDVRASRVSDLEKLERELEATLKKCDAESAALQAQLDSTLGQQITDDQRSLTSKQGALDRLHSEIKNYDDSLAADRERVSKLKESGILGGLRRFMGNFSDNYDLEKVSTRIGVESNLRSEAVVQLGQKSGEVLSLQSDISNNKATYESKKVAISAKNDKAKRERKEEHFRARANRIKEAENAEGKVCQFQVELLGGLQNILGENIGLTAESSAEAWLALYDKVLAEIAKQQERIAFMSDWEKCISDKPEAIAKFLKAQTNVFLATCVGVGGWRSLVDGTYDRRFDDVDGLKQEHFFDLVIVDEAGHATFAETIIPLSMGRRAILIGDDKQLPPMEDDELETYSLFTRLWEDEGCRVPRVMLDTQFRMHPDIANFVSDTFYNGELKNGVSKAERDFQFSSFNKPVCLMSTSNQKKRFELRRNTSYENQLEAEYVREIVASLIQHCQEHGDKDEEVSVAVITPYAEQVSLIRRLLRPFIGASGNVKLGEKDIASVDKFQGDERDIIIASFVRSPDPRAKYKAKMTFVQDLKRMNVAFSRPKKMLIMVGDIKALSTGLGNEDGRKAFEKFHQVARSSGREILAWERSAK